MGVFLPGIAGIGQRRSSRPVRTAADVVLFLFFLLLLTAGCSELARNSAATVRLAIARKPDATPDPAQVAASPYAQIKVDAPSGGAILLLGSIDDGRQAWYSNDRRIVYLRDGLLAGTVGLEQDATDVRIEGDNPFARLPELRQPVTVQRRYDWMPGYRYGVSITGRLRPLETATVDILGVARQLMHFEETLTGPGVRATNEYWADPDTGFIWKSRQMVAPGVSLDILQLKPYRPEDQG